VSSIAIAYRNPYLERPPSSSLADVVDLILDKGLVIDAYVRVSLLGIELLTIDARIVIASVDTYLRFAEAVGRLDLDIQRSQPRGLPDLLEDLKQPGTRTAKHALEGVAKTVFKMEQGVRKAEHQLRGGNGHSEGS
jgi:gas vesicle structural protein